jgi:hypothetical protein
LELSSFENKSLNYFFERGLNKNIHPNANITLILTTIRNKTKLETHDFAYKDDNKKLVFDIPYYHKNVPEGFSVFCTDEEFDLVMNYIKKKESSSYHKSKIKEKEREKENNINIISEPEPSKKNFICQLCRSRFDNYKEHIISEMHCKNIKKHKNSFNKLSSSFKRIIKKNYSYEKNFIYETPIKEKNKDNSYIKSLSSLLTNESNNLIEFSPEEFKKNYNYNLRVKKSPSFGRNNNDTYNYFTSSSKNNYIKIVKNENDVNSPQQSTVSSTYKNMYTLMEEISEMNKFNGKYSNHKRKRDDYKDGNKDDKDIKDKYRYGNYIEMEYSKNKKIKK